MNSTSCKASTLKIMLLPATVIAAVAGGLLVLAVSISSATAAHHESKEATMDVVDTAMNAGNFDTLVAAIQAAGLVDTLKGEGPFTVFAPTDEAFAKIPADQLEKLLADKDALTQVLTYHVLPGQVMAVDIVDLQSAKTVQGQEITIQTKGDAVMVDGANLVATDIVASNGVIHVVDTVIMPN